ncbi:TRAP transporter small permease [Modicisalibacter xianhensis]|uniref:TRAP transporter small permease protein n=1 Tax=Modicisalibacter xianhensis TaxID=442341 RepID=A0A1I2XTR3_9GAMM|nr:TRAP transporter small permease [Halomonas xianhensis]SFH16096.1 TRAP-type C4-dicarboxylate transport system, small permease component [Halomonas xianhensis]
MTKERLAHDSEALEALAEIGNEEFDPRNYRFEDYVTLVIFWLLALDVFLQFFSRYVLGDSIAWTEEMARYLLILVCFIGGAMAVRKNSHIMVEFFYRYMPPVMGRLLSTLVDIARVVFFAAAAWITYGLAGRTHSMMVSVDIPKSYLYYAVMAGFLLMLLRAVQVAIRHWREGTSELLATDDDDQ